MPETFRFDGGSGTFVYHPEMLRPLVTRYLERVADDIEREAKSLVGKDTGHLAQSIGSRVISLPRAADGIAVIGTSVNSYPATLTGYAYWHHEGTMPHLIFPQKAEFLRFRTRRGVVYAKVVRHPGNRPNPYLVIPLRKAVGI